MAFRVTYPIPAAIGGGAAFTGGQGELLRYLQGMQLQYDRMAQDDLQQQRALAFQAAQQQNAIRARLADQQLGAALDFRRMGMQADLAREGRAFAGEEAAKGRAHDLARDEAMAGRRMKELEFGRAAELEDAAALLDGMEGEVLGGMDTSILPDGPLKTRIGELTAALDEVKSDPKYNDEQRIAARRRIIGELSGLRGSYQRQAKPPKTIEEEWESNVAVKPEGVLIRQPDGSLDYRPNTKADPTEARLERAAKIRDSISGMEESLLDSEMKLMEFEMKLAEMEVEVPGQPTLDPQTGQMKKGVSTFKPRYNDAQIQQKTAGMRFQIKARRQRIQQRQAELEALEQEAMDEVRGIEQGELPAGAGGNQQGQPPAPPEAQPATGPLVPQPSQPAPQQGGVPTDQQISQQLARMNPNELAMAAEGWKQADDPHLRRVAGMAAAELARRPETLGAAQQQQAAPAAASQQTIETATRLGFKLVRTPEEVAALPAGTRFITPDGRTGTAKGRSKPQPGGERNPTEAELEAYGRR